MPPPLHAAITNNEKLFPVFAKRLSSHNPDTYIAAATKFARWLSSERAYYDVARPKIVELLEVAYNNYARLMENAQNRANPSLAQVFADLLRTVTPYRRLFVEPQLQNRLHDVFRHVMVAPPQWTAPATDSQPTNLPMPTRASTVESREYDPPPPYPGTFAPPPQIPEQAERRAPDPFSSLMALDLDWFKTKGQQPPATARSDVPVSAPAQPTPPGESQDIAAPPPAETAETVSMEQTADPSETLPAPEVVMQSPIASTSPPPTIDGSRQDDTSPELEDLNQSFMDVSQNEDTIAFENYELFIEQDTKDDIVEGLPIVVDVPAEPTPVVQVTPVPDIGDGMTIMYDGQGPNRPGTVSIKFQIEESLLPMISTWVNQSRTNVVDRSSSLCVSLACYLLSDLEDAYVRAIEKPTTTEQLLSMTKSLWPDSGTLSLRFHHKDVDMHLPLSPPIVVTPDQYFDLSQFIKGGQNEFKLLQRCDMSNCVYFVQVHHPTQLQLGVLASRRQLDESWNQFLATMKRPLEHQAPWNEIIKPSS